MTTAVALLLMTALLLFTALLGGFAFVLPTVLLRLFPFVQAEPEEEASPSPAE